MATPDDDRDLLAKKVAYLVAQDRQSQAKIKALLHLGSQSEVSRLLKFAEKKEWVKRWELNLTDEDLREIRGHIFEQHDELMRKLARIARQNHGVPPSELVVIGTPDGSTPEKGAGADREYFGRAAAEHVVSLLNLQSVKTCAVAWGWTIKSLINAIPPQKPRKQLLFIPVSGEPFRVRDVDFSPTAAARGLADIFGCDALSLAGAVARIPKDLKKHARTIREFVSCCGDYKAIFTGDRPRIQDLDMILTGVGDAATSKDDPWFKQTRDAEGGGDLGAFAVGNIGGVWLPKDRSSQRHKDQTAELNSRWLGIQEDHFRTCAERVEEGRCPGVVVVATTPQKAQIVARVVGLVNHLVIDRSLAEAIVEL